MPPRSRPWGTAYCLSAATSGRRKGRLSREAPGERTTMFRDASGRPVKTPSRPLPSLYTPREIVNDATRAWHAYFGESGACRDANSKFKGTKRHLRVSWSGCEPTSEAPPVDVPSEVGGNPGVPPIPLSLVLSYALARRVTSVRPLRRSRFGHGMPRTVAGLHTSPCLIVGLLTRAVDMTCCPNGGSTR